MTPLTYLRSEEWTLYPDLDFPDIPEIRRANTVSRPWLPWHTWDNLSGHYTQTLTPMTYLRSEERTLYPDPDSPGILEITRVDTILRPLHHWHTWDQKIGHHTQTLTPITYLRSEEWMDTIPRHWLPWHTWNQKSGHYTQTLTHLAYLRSEEWTLYPNLDFPDIPEIRRANTVSRPWLPWPLTAHVHHTALKKKDYYNRVAATNLLKRVLLIVQLQITQRSFKCIKCIL